MAPAAVPDSSREDTNMASFVPRNETIEERFFSAALICLEAHCAGTPPMGSLTYAKMASMISKTLEKSHNFKEVRESLSRNVGIWIWLTRIFATVIPSLTVRSVGPLSSLNDPDNAATALESTNLIVTNYASLKEDLQILNKLMHIARNMLVTPEPAVAQDLCAAVQFDQMVYQTIILCVSVTSKGYDGEVLDESARAKLNEINELFKKVLVTSLQQAHNWTAKHDRNKMSFWLNVLFDEESLADEQELGLAEFRTSQARTEVRHWLERNSRMCAKARLLLQDYHQNLSHKPPGKLAAISPLAWNWLPEGSVEVLADDPAEDSKHAPQWDEEETDNFKQDQAYGRVSREVDTWWLKVRDTNYDEWVVPMPSVDFAQVRAETSKATLSSRYAHTYRADDQEGSITDEDEDGEPEEDGQHGVYGHLDATEPSPEGTAAPSAEQDGADEDVHGHPHHVQDYVDDLGDEEDLDDDDSYGEGPMTGLLTEVPNILNPKEIEALHMIVKSCILDSAGMGLTRAGENLQKTRCRMLLALDCGKSLLREMLVFIAVWEKDETTLIFQITSQIVEAIHHSALIPYAWQSLRIPKDIISPAQTVLLRLIDHIFRSRSSSPSTAESKENLRDVKLLHFLFIQFRSRIVPECIALMYLQEEIRNGKCNPHDFPVDTWDMERAKDGLHQFLEFLNSVCVFPETRSYLVQWEASYELIALLKALEAGVPRKPLVDLPDRSASRPAPSAPENMDGTAPASAPLPNRDAWRHDVATGQAPPPPPPPPLPHQEEAYSFPWSGIKAYVLSILAELLQPPAGKSTPGNPDVQAQIVKHNGIVPLLNCCVYDDHNRYARERVQICLKWLMDGSQSANDFLRNLVHSAAPPRPQPASPPTSGPVSGQPPPPTLSKTTTLRVDGIAGELKVQVGPLAKPPTGLPVTGTPGHHGPSAAGGSLSHPTASSSAAHTSRAPPPASAASAAAAAAARATAPLRPPHMSPAEYLSELQDMLATHASNAGVTLPPIQIREGQVTFGQSGVKTSAAFAAMAAAAAAAPQGALGKPEELLRDIITLADEAARFALGQGADAEETEEEEFM